MNQLSPIASTLMEATGSTLENGMHKAQEWSGRIVRILQSLSATLGRHPNAAIAVIALANTLFFFVLDGAIKRFEAYRAKSDNHETPIEYKQIAISEAIGAVSVLGFNVLLSKATQAQLDAQSLAALTATSLVLRILFKRMLKERPKEVEQTEPKLVVETPGNLKSPRVSEDIDFERILGDSPEKSQVVETSVAEKPTSDVEILTLRSELADEKARADEIQAEKSMISAKVASLNLLVAKLEQDKKKLENGIQIAEALTAATEKEVTQQKDQNKVLEAKIEDLDGEISQLKGLIATAEAAQKAADKKLRDMDAQFQQERDQLRKENAQLKVEAANAGRDLIRAEEDHKKALKKLNGRITDLEHEKGQAVKGEDEAKNKLAKEKQAFDQAVIDLNAKNDAAEKKIQKIEQELADATQKVSQAEKAASDADLERKIALFDKKSAHSRMAELEVEIKELRQQLDSKRALPIHQPVDAVDLFADDNAGKQTPPLTPLKDDSDIHRGTKTDVGPRRARAGSVDSPKGVPPSPGKALFQSQKKKYNY